MAVKLGQSLRQTQSLLMTPQLQQAIKMLTLTHLEMTQVISEQLVENPLLEEFEPDNESTKSETDYKLEGLERDGQEPEPDFYSDNSLMSKKNNEDFDWEKYVESFNSTTSLPTSTQNTSYDDGQESLNYENIVSKPESLTDHLLWQLRMEVLSQEEWDLAHEIIYNLDENGHLMAPLQDLLKVSKLPHEDAIEIVRMIQRFDPIGCACSSISESLWVQSKILFSRDPLIKEILFTCFDMFQRDDFAGISKSLDVSLDKIKNSCDFIKQLSPNPGHIFSTERTHYIIPDIYLRRSGNEFQISLNEDSLPQLRISHLYKSLIKNSHHAKDTKNYVREKLKSALWLLKSIHNRQKTILKVAEAILKHQPEFFHKGPEHLKPMILKDIASEIGMHESTVSRATTNKYIDTPLGVFELKYFFNSGIGGKDGGQSLASESIKRKIKALVEAEEPTHPLSDQRIADILNNENIHIARRTVAKYREMLLIDPSSKRKKRKVG